MCNVVLSLIVSVLLVIPCSAQNDCRVFAEKQYELLGIDRGIADMINGYTSVMYKQLDDLNLSEAVKNERREALAKRINVASITRQYREQIIQMYVDSYTESELKGIIEFLTSPIGKKYLDTNYTVKHKTMEKMEQDFKQQVITLTPFILYGETPQKEADVEVKNLSDREIENRLVGTWIEREYEPMSSVSEHTFCEDRKYRGWGNTLYAGKEHRTFYSGTWEVTNRILIYHITECSNPKILKDSPLVKDHILEISATHFKYQSVVYGSISRMERKDETQPRAPEGPKKREP